MVRKGQAAMEFLMTYGWAILVVLVAIGALAYFGVLNPGRFLPSTCTIMPGISCTEYKVVATPVANLVNTSAVTANIGIKIQNGMGKDLTGVSAEFAGTKDGICIGDDSLAVEAIGGPISLADGATMALLVDCTQAPSDVPIKGARFKSELTFIWTADGVQHQRTGQLISEVE